MKPEELLKSLLAAPKSSDVAALLAKFEDANHSVSWVPIGNRANNEGTIGGTTDAGRALVERVTNAFDAVIELEHDRRNGLPECRSPREAVSAWLNVPGNGLSAMTPQERKKLGERVTLRVLDGDNLNARTVEVVDQGIGLTADMMAQTILSLNESNKVKKFYLAGAYGQGGSSTFNFCDYTLIASKRANINEVGFSVVRYMPPAPDEVKLGMFVYLTLGGKVPQLPGSELSFPHGTIVRHFGYKLGEYRASFGPESIYGLLNRVLFDPVLPLWLENVPAQNQRRTIKGSRNSLNGARDDSDDEAKIAHQMPTFVTQLGDFGRIGIEYWLLNRASDKNPSRSYIEPKKPVILSLNGQNHGELSHILIRKDAELPFLASRLIVHVDCNSLSHESKRVVFVSNREEARKNNVLSLIRDEVVKALRADTRLGELNTQARDENLKEEDAGAEEEARKEVAKLLRVFGRDAVESEANEAKGKGDQRGERPVWSLPSRKRTPPVPLEPKEPPTFVRIVWDEEKDISFSPGRRRYIRIETDANSRYHNANNPEASKFNFIIPDGFGLKFEGSTHLQGGRMNAIVEASPQAQPGATCKFRVEMRRTGMPSLFDERVLVVVPLPPTEPKEQKVSIPKFSFREVQGPDDDQWKNLEWPADVSEVASHSEMSDGTLIIHYSLAFPKFAGKLKHFERQSPTKAKSFTARYRIWLAVHSLLLYEQEQQRKSKPSVSDAARDEAAESFDRWEREERCRLASMAVIFADREVSERLAQDSGNEVD